MPVLVAILSLIVFCVGILLVMISWKGFKLYKDGDLEYLGRGYNSREDAENGFYNNHDPKMKLKAGFVMDKDGNLLANACPSDAEVYLRLKGESSIAGNN